MSLTAQGNSRLPTKIKKPNLHATCTHAQAHTPSHEKKNPHDHRATLTHTQSKTEHRHAHLRK